MIQTKSIGGNQIAGVILAAGASVRMGLPKLVLQWNDKPLIRYPVTAALEADLNPVLVITGKYHQVIVQAISDTPAVTIHNPDWEQGQSTSICGALQSLPPETRGVIFLLGDQPLVPASAILTLVKHYYDTQPHPLILAASVNGKRANPVLIDRAVFPDLLQLTGDAGARQVFQKYPPTLVEMDEPGLLFDVDSPEDYEKLMTH